MTKLFFAVLLVGAGVCVSAQNPSATMIAEQIKANVTSKQYYDALLKVVQLKDALTTLVALQTAQALPATIEKYELVIDTNNVNTAGGGANPGMFNLSFRYLAKDRVKHTAEPSGHTDAPMNPMDMHTDDGKGLIVNISNSPDGSQRVANAHMGHQFGGQMSAVGKDVYTPFKLKGMRALKQENTTTKTVMYTIVVGAVNVVITSSFIDDYALSHQLVENLAQSIDYAKIKAIFGE